jgi:hypothetical protein
MLMNAGRMNTQATITAIGENSEPLKSINNKHRFKFTLHQIHNDFIPKTKKMMIDTGGIGNVMIDIGGIGNMMIDTGDSGVKNYSKCRKRLILKINLIVMTRIGEKLPRLFI